MGNRMGNSACGPLGHDLIDSCLASRIDEQATPGLSRRGGTRAGCAGPVGENTWTVEPVVENSCHAGVGATTVAARRPTVDTNRRWDDRRMADAYAQGRGDRRRGSPGASVGVVVGPSAPVEGVHRRGAP